VPKLNGSNESMVSKLPKTIKIINAGNKKPLILLTGS
jgi:hypothetical protein